MEDALALNPNDFKRALSGVLILVVMEDALAQSKVMNAMNNFTVS